MLNESETVRTLKALGISSPQLKTSFIGWLGPRRVKVQIDIYDGTNESVQHTRYFATATTEDGKKTVTGNSEADIKTALESLSVHFRKLQ